MRGTVHFEWGNLEFPSLNKCFTRGSLIAGSDNEASSSSSEISGGLPDEELTTRAEIGVFRSGSLAGFRELLTFERAIPAFELVSRQLF